MSRTGNSIGNGWSEFLTEQDERVMTIERAHELARTFLEERGFPLDSYTVDARSEDGSRVSVTIQPRPVLPSFSAQWDNEWRR